MYHRKKKVKVTDREEYIYNYRVITLKTINILYSYVYLKNVDIDILMEVMDSNVNVTDAKQSSKG